MLAHKFSQFLTVEALSHDWEEIFAICLFCWIRVGCWEIFGDDRHLYLKGSCNNLYKVNVLCFVPDPCIPGECCILLDAHTHCVFFNPKLTEYLVALRSYTDLNS